MWRGQCVGGGGKCLECSSSERWKLKTFLTSLLRRSPSDSEQMFNKEKLWVIQTDLLRLHPEIYIHPKAHLRYDESWAEWNHFIMQERKTPSAVKMPLWVSGSCISWWLMCKHFRTCHICIWTLAPLLLVQETLNTSFKLLRLSYLMWKMRKSYQTYITGSLWGLNEIMYLALCQAHNKHSVWLIT